MFRKQFRSLFIYTTAILVILSIVATIFTLYHDIQVNIRYQEASCTVLAKEVRHPANEFRPLVQVAYTYNNQPYTRWTPASRIHNFFKTEQEATATLNQFQLNSSFKCWVDPASPMSVELEKKYHIRMYVFTILWLLITSFVIFNMLYKRQSYNSTEISNSSDNLSGDLFEIKVHRFTIEYIYRGRRPVTPESLPKEFQRNFGTKQLLVNKINETGRLITLKKPYAYLLCVVMVFLLYLCFRLQLFRW